MQNILEYCQLKYSKAFINYIKQECAIAAPHRVQRGPTLRTQHAIQSRAVHTTVLDTIRKLVLQ